MIYKVQARIENDVRQIEVDNAWDAMVMTYGLVKEKKGWPEKVTYGGYCIADEEELNNFYKKLDAIMRLADHVKRLDKFKKDTLKAIRIKVVPK